MTLKWRDTRMLVFHLDDFWPFVARFGFSYQKNRNKHCNVQMETLTKNQNEQQKAKTSNQKHLPVLVFEIEQATRISLYKLTQLL